MNFSSEFERSIDILCARFGIALDWGNENVVPYLKDLMERFIQFKIQTSTFYTCISLFIFVVGVILLIIGAVMEHNRDDGFLSLVIGFIGAVSGFIGACINIYVIIKCNTIPEMIVLEYLKNVMGVK